MPTTERVGWFPCVDYLLPAQPFPVDLVPVRVPSGEEAGSCQVKKEVGPWLASALMSGAMLDDRPAWICPKLLGRRATNPQIPIGRNRSRDRTPESKRPVDLGIWAIVRVWVVSNLSGGDDVRTSSRPVQAPPDAARTRVGKVLHGDGHPVVRTTHLGKPKWTWPGDRDRSRRTRLDFAPTAFSQIDINDRISSFRRNRSATRIGEKVRRGPEERSP
jgi:hypothetical protein